MFRTYPLLRDNDKRVYRIGEPANQLAQMQLYRWSRSENFVNNVGITDLRSYLIDEPFSNSDLPMLPSRSHFGRTVLNALSYDPRKLKGSSKDYPEARRVYNFFSPLELQYGLEYMICGWLRKFLNDFAAPGTVSVSGQQAMSEELNILSDTPWEDYIGLYVEPLQTSFAKKFEEPDWRELLKREGGENEPTALKAQEPNRKLKLFSV